MNTGKWAWKLRSVSGNVTTHVEGLTDKHRMIAWFLAGPQMWSFRSGEDKEGLIEAQAGQLAELTGRTVYGRVTTRPYPVEAWARASWANSPDPTLGAARVLERDQEFLRSRQQAEKLAYYGVDLGVRSRITDKLGRVVPSLARQEEDAIAERLAEVAGVMAGAGIDAIPAVGNDMAWLLARSFALGCPIPAQEHTEEFAWSESDLATFTNSVHWSAEPLAQSVKVQSIMGEDRVTRHVVVLTVAQMADIRIPEKHSPWIAQSDLMPFPVEWAFRFDVQTPEETSAKMLKLTDRIRNQIRHYTDDHGIDPPRQLERQADRAAEVEDEMRAEFDGLSARTKGWYRVAVSAPTEKEALKRAQKLIDKYKPQIRLVRELDQFRLAREFVPGEPVANKGHERHLPVLKVAAGLPAVTAEVGDRRGILLGETASMSRRAVTWCPWYLPEVVEASGLVPLIGEMGSGKTVLAGTIIYKTVLQGAPWTVMDPTGRLAQLATLPELRDLTRVIRVLNSDAGTLSPYAVVAEPRLEWFTDDPEVDDPVAAWEQAKITAQTQRRRLAFDTLRWCLPVHESQSPEVLTALRDGIAQTSALSGSSALSVIDRLRAMDADAAPLVARRLDEARDGDMSRLFFSTPIMGTTTEAERAVRLTIYSLQGMPQVNEARPREEWGTDELLVQPLMNLAAWATLRGVYNLGKHARKGVFIDEMHEITKVSSGAGLFQKIATDTRKWDLVGMLATQNTDKIIGQGLGNHVGAAFVGRTLDPAAQGANCELLRLPRGVGYEAEFGRLSRKRRIMNGTAPTPTPREFVFRDGIGGEDGQSGMEKIRIDISAHPELMAALNSTADPTKVRRPHLVKNDNLTDGDDLDVDEFEGVA